MEEKMKTFKKLLALTVASAILLVGCSSNTNQPANNISTPATTPAAEESDSLNGAGDIRTY